MSRRKRRRVPERPLEQYELEVLLPSQHRRAERLATLQPERRLLVAVLDEAIQTALRIPPRRATADSWAWISSDDTGWPLSFCNVCDALGLDSGAVRTALARRRRERGADGAAE